MKDRKAQSGGSAATLVAVIGLLIVLYILFLPPDVREDLLDDDNDTSDYESGYVVKNLLLEKPGRLEELEESQIEHNLPAVNLYSLTGAEIIKKVSSLYVKNGVFDKKDESFVFGIDSLEQTSNILLSFGVAEAKGNLIIRLNGKEIFNSVITTKNVPPIELSDDLLAAENTLEFEVSGVGMAFWKTNEYSINNIQITADVTDVSSQESRNVFVISETEKHNVEKARLRFFPDCDPGNVGLLDVMINNHVVFSSVPDCGILRPIEFSPAYLEAGENKIVFKTAKGRYLIDQVSVTTMMKEITFPSYYFELESDDYADVVNNKYDVNMTLRFVDGTQTKRGKVFVNGKTVAINTNERSYSRSLDNYVEAGQNGLRIEPDNTVLDIIDLRIDLVKH